MVRRTETESRVEGKVYKTWRPYVTPDGQKGMLSFIQLRDRGGFGIEYDSPVAIFSLELPKGSTEVRLGLEVLQYNSLYTASYRHPDSTYRLVTVNNFQRFRKGKSGIPEIDKASFVDIAEFRAHEQGTDLNKIEELRK